MILRGYLRTIDLALAVGISVQQVRNYEAWGMLPPTERSKNGYRLYTQKHLVALKAVKSMIDGYSWQRTRTIMREVHGGELSAALALIDTSHAELASKRLQVEQTLAALRALVAQSATLHSTRHPH